MGSSMSKDSVRSSFILSRIGSKSPWPSRPNDVNFVNLVISRLSLYSSPPIPNWSDLYSQSMSKAELFASRNPSYTSLTLTSDEPKMQNLLHANTGA